MSNKSRWLVFSRNDSRRALVGFYARGFEKARNLSEELFPGDEFYVVQFKLQSGWKDFNPKSLYFTKDSTYGMRYLCKACGRETLGLGSYNHCDWCPHKPVRTSSVGAEA